VNTERLAERETLLYRLGSEFNRNVQDYCGNHVMRRAKTRDICAQPGFSANRAIHTKKEAKKTS
jgi:hypothetical protein